MVDRELMQSNLALEEHEDFKPYSSMRMRYRPKIVSSNKVRLEVLGYLFSSKEVKTFSRMLQGTTTLEIFKQIDKLDEKGQLHIATKDVRQQIWAG